MVPNSRALLVEEPLAGRGGEEKGKEGKGRAEEVAGSTVEGQSGEREQKKTREEEGEDKRKRRKTPSWPHMTLTGFADWGSLQF